MKSTTRHPKPRPGDVFAVPIDTREAYLQLVNYDATMGELIRVLPGVYGERLGDLTWLIKGNERFLGFYPVAPALKKGYVTFVGHYEVPNRLRQLPAFRSPVSVNPRTKKVDVWALWDSVGQRMVGELSEEQKSLPIRAVMNHALLVERIVNGWTPAQYE